MGCPQSKANKVDAGNDVDAFLREQEEARKNEIKILLLGAGESGKSTVIKQCKMLYIKGGLTAAERKKCANALKLNAIESLVQLITQRRKFGIDLADLENGVSEPEIAKLGETYMLSKLQGSDLDFPVELATKMFNLWKDASIQATYARRNEFHILDSAAYYLDECVRFADEDFEDELTDDDLMLARILTTGVEETMWHEGQLTFKLIDVAGQRSARKKWIDHFDDVKAVLFLAGLSGYNQKIGDDGETNRLRESLQVFDDITKLDAFKNTPVYLLLNKKDLFEQQIQDTSAPPLSNDFPDYTGDPQNMHEALGFIQAQYEAIFARNSPKKPLHVHVIAARLRMDMKLAFGEMKQAITEYHARTVGSPRKRAQKRGVEGTRVIRKNIIVGNA